MKNLGNQIFPIAKIYRQTLATNTFLFELKYLEWCKFK